jgi:HAD superfamily phosphoserine phosphatase-like hydrolase
METPPSGIKLVSFDLNGTIIRENTWVDLIAAMGVTQAEDDELLKQHASGKLSYAQCQKKLQDLFISRGKATFNNIADSLFRYHLVEGTRDVVSYLKEKGYTLVLLSSSIDMLVARIAEDLEVPDWAANNKMLFDGSGKLTKIDVMDEDTVFKLNALKQIAGSHGIQMDQCACVGDAENDKDLFQATGYGIAMAGSKAAQFARQTINSISDLKTIL